MAGVRRLQTVAETRAFADDIDAMLTSAARDLVIAEIAAIPHGGDLIPDTGGLRKRRIALPGGGKRGGARVITLFLNEDFPVYAVFIYAKKERADLTPAQRRVLARLVRDIKAEGSEEDKAMKKERFARLVESLDDVRTHIVVGRFAGRISNIAVGPDDIRRLRAHSGMTQAQFAAAFGIGLGTLQKWERGECRPSGAAKSLLRVMQADTPAVVRALGITPVVRRRSA
jgi:DNA-binding XRE family transcriptional regulator